MKRLIAVMSCHRKSAWANAQRQTWVKDVVERGYADVVFFLGRGDAALRYVSYPKRDEVWLDVPDDYRGIPLKVQAIMRWAAERCYDITAKCDDDVYVVPDRVPYLPIDAHYVGRFRAPHGSVYPVHFASGFFYWLDNQSMKIVADTPWNGDWMDERFVATALARRGIIGNHDPVNYLVTGPHHAAPALLSNDAFRKGTVFCEYGPNAIHAHHLAMRRLSPVRTHPGLVLQPQATVTDAILTSAPNDDIPPHKLDRSYFVN